MLKGPPSYIILAGSIGTGKTTAIDRIGFLRQDVVSFYEERDIYLGDFYTDPFRYAFMNQLAYTLQYVEQAAAIANSTNPVIQDRSIYDTHQVFSDLRRKEGAISEKEFLLLDRLLRISHSLVRPTHLVFLTASVEVAFYRVRERSIAIEADLSIGYLDTLSRAYFDWYRTFDLCPKFHIHTDLVDPNQVASTIIEKVFSSS